MSDNNILLKEWEECQKSLTKFDDIILNIRKYGFTFITILLSADGFLYSRVDLQIEEKFGIYFALMVLIIGLFRIDRYHEIFLRGAVERAMVLEDELGMGLSKSITKWSKRLNTATWGVGLYLLFCVANYLLIMGTILSKFTTKPSYNVAFRDIVYITVASLIILIIVLYICPHLEMNELFLVPQQ